MAELYEFEKWPSITRFRREILITEKIDGTNAQISIRVNDGAEYNPDLDTLTTESMFVVRAGSRSRWLGKGKKEDNHGFGQWVSKNAQELTDLLGEGRHYGEWWGQGIQRRYGLDHKVFSLFNVHRWADVNTTLGDSVVTVVPTLYTGPWTKYIDGYEESNMVEQTLWDLEMDGSVAAPGFDKPEGIIVCHVPSRHLYKVTIENDETPKSLV